MSYRAPLMSVSVSQMNMTPGPAMFTAFLCVLFGANAVAVKASYAGIAPFTVAAIRFSMAPVIILTWAVFTGRRIGIQKGQFIHVFIIGVLFTIQVILFHLGLFHSNASRGTILVNMVPFFVLFLAHFFIPGDRITPAKFLGILLGFGGVVLVCWEDAGVGSLKGDLIILVATVAWAADGVYMKRVLADFEPFHLVFYPMLMAAPVMWILSMGWDGTALARITPVVVGAVAYQTLVSASFGFVAWCTLLQKYGAAAMHAFVFIMPISGVTLGGLLLHEPVTPKIFGALAAIVIGIIVVNKPVRRTPRPPAP